MASPNSTFTEMVTTTLRNHPTEVSDNVSKHNALYRRLKVNGKIRKLSGGYEIVRPLDYAENSTYQRYSGYDFLNINASDVLSAAKYDWCQSAVHVTASGRELRMNSGSEQLIDLAAARTRNAMRTAANNMSTDLYSSGALANQMGGLGLIINTAGTGTVGGINSSTFTFWQNQFQEASGTNTYASGNATDIYLFRKDMMSLWMNCTRGTDQPDLIVSSQDFYAAFWGTLVPNQRYTSDDREATAGFNSLRFQQADVIFDRESTNFSTTAEKMYFLNSEYLELNVHRDANWTTLDEKMSVNQDAVVIPIIWQGQLTCSNRALQGILIDAS
jgi:hypothetical protein